MAEKTLRYKALKNFTMGTGKPDTHKHVKAGEVHEIDQDYAETHLNPLDLDEDETYDPDGAHKDSLVEPTDEPVTVAKPPKKEKKPKKAEKADKGDSKKD